MSQATLRAVHGTVALALATLLALYTLSGWLIIHPFGSGPAETRAVTTEVDPVGGASADVAGVRKAAERAAARVGLTGGVSGKPKFRGGEWRVRVSRAARSADVALVPGARVAEVSLREVSFAGGIAGLHRVTATGATGARLAWVLAKDLLSIALLLFSLTGVLLFMAVKRERRLGWLALGAGTLYTLASFAYLAVAR